MHSIFGVIFPLDFLFLLLGTPRYLVHLERHHPTYMLSSELTYVVIRVLLVFIPIIISILGFAVSMVSKVSIQKIRYATSSESGHPASVRRSC